MQNTSLFQFLFSTKPKKKLRLGKNNENCGDSRFWDFTNKKLVKNIQKHQTDLSMIGAFSFNKLKKADVYFAKGSHFFLNANNMIQYDTLRTPTSSKFHPCPWYTLYVEPTLKKKYKGTPYWMTTPRMDFVIIVQNIVELS